MHRIELTTKLSTKSKRRLFRELNVHRLPSIMNFPIANKRAAIRNILVGVLLLVLLVELQLRLTSNRLKILDEKLFDDATTDKNTVEVRSRRQDYASKLQCDHPAESNEIIQTEWYTPPASTDRPMAAPIYPCQYTILDLGAGSGESLGWFVDAGIPECVSDEGSKVGHYDVSMGTVMLELSTTPMAPTNPVTAWATQVMLVAGKQTKGRKLEPEEYCYYGIEVDRSNTALLQHVETMVLQSNPRPVRQVYYFTETVAAVQDGPTTYTPEASSDKATSSQKVQGMTVTSLLKKTVGSDVGNHVMIRMNGSNAYDILNNAFDLGTLCDYAEQAIRLDILIQTENNQDEAYEYFRDVAKKELHFCGVHVHTQL